MSKIPPPPVILSQKERNRRLFLLLQIMINNQDNESIQLLETMLCNDTAAMQKSYQIMTENINVWNIPCENNDLLLSEISVGHEVCDKDGDCGIVIDVDDIHNVVVKFEGGQGLYCLDKTCLEYEGLVKSK